MPLSIIPAVFGVQQLSEGIVWLGLTRNDPQWTRSGALAFLFFALAFWPFWMPIATAFLERGVLRRRIWWAVTALSIGWGVFLYLPILWNPAQNLDVQVLHFSIDYDYRRVPLVQAVAPLLLRGLYLATCAVPLIACSDARVRWFGILLVVSAVLTHIIFSYAFASVWCFFAAILAAYLCWVIPRSSAPDPTATEQTSPSR